MAECRPDRVNGEDKVIGVYKYVYNDEIIYVGKSDTDISLRIHAHTFEEKFLPYLSDCKIYYALCKNPAHTTILETYLINKYKPILNVAMKYDDDLGITISEPEWNEYNKSEINSQNIDKSKEKKEENCLIPYVNISFLDFYKVKGYGTDSARRLREDLTFLFKIISLQKTHTNSIKLSIGINRFKKIAKDTYTWLKFIRRFHQNHLESILMTFTNICIIDNHNQIIKPILAYDITSKNIEIEINPALTINTIFKEIWQNYWDDYYDWHGDRSKQHWQFTDKYITRHHGGKQEVLYLYRYYDGRQYIFDKWAKHESIQ